MGKVTGVLDAMGFHLGQDQRRKMVALDNQFAEMESQITTLQKENLHLRAQVNPLERQIDRLKDQIQKQGAANHLEPLEIEIMKFIGNGKSVTSGDIGKGMNMHSVAVEHFIGRLLKADYIGQAQVPMLGAMYSLSDKGNAYLVEKNLVPLPNVASRQISNPKGHRCDHCGSTQLRRTGSRPDPNFSEVGIKQALYSCLSCDQESAFTNDEP